jgi:ABC-type uncharacterized transport system permease subunit
MENTTTKKIQWVITISLALILLGIVGGYIYYGMRLAKQGDATAVTEITASTTDVAPTVMTREQKMAILESLSVSTGATNTPTVENREKILDALRSAPDSNTPKMTEEEKLKVLKSLSN